MKFLSVLFIGIFSFNARADLICQSTSLSYFSYRSADLVGDQFSICSGTHSPNPPCVRYKVTNCQLTNAGANQVSGACSWHGGRNQDATFIFKASNNANLTDVMVQSSTGEDRVDDNMDCQLTTSSASS